MERWDWIGLYPPAQQLAARRRRARLRGLAQLREPRTWVSALLALELGLALLLGVGTGAVLGALVLLQLLLAPLLAGLVWWLVWSEFHR
jgi:hypothetical protein